MRGARCSSTRSPTCWGRWRWVAASGVAAAQGQAPLHLPVHASRASRARRFTCLQDQIAADVLIKVLKNSKEHAM